MICFWDCVPSPSKFSCARVFSLNCNSRWAKTPSEHFSYGCCCSCIVHLCSVTVWQAMFRVKFSRPERQADMKTCPTRLHPHLSVEMACAGWEHQMVAGDPCSWWKGMIWGWIFTQSIQDFPVFMSHGTSFAFVCTLSCWFSWPEISLFTLQRKSLIKTPFKSHSEDEARKSQ